MQMGPSTGNEVQRIGTPYRKETTMVQYTLDFWLSPPDSTDLKTWEIIDNVLIQWRGRGWHRQNEEVRMCSFCKVGLLSDSTVSDTKKYKQSSLTKSPFFKKDPSREQLKLPCLSSVMQRTMNNSPTSQSVPVWLLFIKVFVTLCCDYVGVTLILAELDQDEIGEFWSTSNPTQTWQCLVYCYNF